MSARAALHTRIFLGGLVAAALVAAASSASAQTPTEVSGTLMVVWGDPADPRDPVRHHFSILTDAGEVVDLALDPGAGGEIADPFPLANRRVTARVLARPAFDGGTRGGPAPVVALRSAGTDPQRAAAVPEPLPFHTLLCKFPDWPDLEPTSAADMAARLAGYPGTPDYWLEVSGGRVDVSGPVTGWHVLPRGREDYAGGAPEPPLGTIAQDCAAAADAEVDFSGVAGVNFVFNTNLGCCNYGGSAAIEVEGTVLHVRATWLSGDVAWNQGIQAHEVGHSLGLPHASGPYGSTYDSFWDVMSWAAWYAVPGTDFLVGSHTNIYHKDLLGWVPAARRYVVGPGSQTILVAPTANPDAEGYLYVRLPTPGFPAWEYYTLEARGGRGYDEPLPGAGVVIHRIGGGGATPSNALDLDGDGDVSDGGALLEVGERFDDPRNGITVAVEGTEGSSFRVRIDLADHPRLVVDTTSAAYAATVTEPLLLDDSVQVFLEGPDTGSEWTARISSGVYLRLLSAAGGNGDWLRWRVDTRGLPPGQSGGMIRIEYGGKTTDLFSRAVIAPEAGLVAGLGLPWIQDSTLAGTTKAGGTYLLIQGPGADTAAWTAVTDAPWITIDSTAGVGSGSVGWTRDFTGLPDGIHTDSVVIDVPGAAGSPLVARETIRVIERPTVTVTRLAGSGTVRQGAMPLPDSIRVDLTGHAGLGAGWYLSAGGDGHVRPSGYAHTGSRWAVFTREPGNRPPGTYVTPVRVTPLALPFDTITFMDTLVVEAAPNALRAYPDHRSATVVGATEFSRDSVYLHPEGPDAATKEWIITFPEGRIIPHAYYQGGRTHAQGSGPEWITWLRVLDGRAPGLHVDTIEVRFHGTGEETAIQILDSLTVLGTPTIAVGPRAGAARVVVGSDAQVPDSATVHLTGHEAAAVRWTATAAAPWIQLADSAGTGGGTLRWTRHPGGLEAGLHVDTLRVFAAAIGSPALLVDSLVVVPPLAISSAGDRPAATMGAPYADTLTADNADGAVSWTLVDGALPPGLALDGASGRIAGIPEADGVWEWTVQATEGAQTATAALALVVTRPVLALDATIAALLGGPALPADHARFLDLIGNRNDRMDVGDVAAWLAAPDTGIPDALRADARRRLGLRN